MPIVLYEEHHDDQGGWYPRFVCDRCGELIAEPHGVVAWDLKWENPPLLYVAHSNECDRALQAQHDTTTAWMHCAEFAHKLGLSLK